jgi:hypothetical protein
MALALFLRRNAEPEEPERLEGTMNSSVQAMTPDDLAKHLQKERQAGIFDEMMDQYDRQNAVEAHTV